MRKLIFSLHDVKRSKKYKNIIQSGRYPGRMPVPSAGIF